MPLVLVTQFPLAACVSDSGLPPRAQGISRISPRYGFCT